MGKIVSGCLNYFSHDCVASFQRPPKSKHLSFAPQAVSNKLIDKIATKTDFFIIKTH